MPEKRESLENAEGVVLQDPRAKAKATLPESQSPVAVTHAQCYSVYSAVPPGVDRSRFCGLLPPTGRTMGSESIEGDEWDA
jgi:hypothetical protein